MIIPSNILFKHNNIEKENINGSFYPKNTTNGQYTPSQAYLDMLKEKQDEVNRIKEKTQYTNIVENDIVSIYRNTINSMRQKTALLYEKVLYLADNEIGNIFQQIKQIMTETNKKVSEMMQEIRQFLGYRFTFSKYGNNNNLIPIEPNVIKKAWDMLSNQNKYNFIDIENALMF